MAKKLLDGADNPAAVMEVIGSRLRPTDARGSIASEFEARLHLLAKLDVGDNPVVAAAFDAVREELAEIVERQRKYEDEAGQRESGRFE
jgi:hypothetical protein